MSPRPSAKSKIGCSKILFKISPPKFPATQRLALKITAKIFRESKSGFEKIFRTSKISRWKILSNYNKYTLRGNFPKNFSFDIMTR